MNVFCARAARSLITAGLGLMALVAVERPLQARQAEPLLQPTPLVLKDGRIASVSIHVVPFAPGRADLGGEAAARVAELTRAVGTDCFLTAQVIGHIDASEVAQDDTLNAHRLARSRADAVQASLIGGDCRPRRSPACGTGIHGARAACHPLDLSVDRRRGLRRPAAGRRHGRAGGAIEFALGGRAERAVAA